MYLRLCSIVKFAFERPLNVAKNFLWCAAYSPGERLLTVKMETRGPFGREFSAFVIIVELSWPEVATPEYFLVIFAFFRQKAAYGKIFSKILFRKLSSSVSPIDIGGAYQGLGRGAKPPIFPHICGCVGPIESKLLKKYLKDSRKHA